MKAIVPALALVLTACGWGVPTVDSKPVAAAPAVALTGRLVDQARVFDSVRGRALEQRLEQLEQATTDQLVVVSLPTLNGQAIDKYALSLANDWKIGRADVDNGVVMLVAPNEKKIWISVGSGLEGLLTNRRTQAIVDRMLPDFKRGDLPGGIERGVSEIEQLLEADKRRPQYSTVPARKAA